MTEPCIPKPSRQYSCMCHFYLCPMSASMRYTRIKHEAGIILRVHLQDGTSFRMVYYPKANVFSAGAFGTEKLKLLIMSQRQQIKAAAGL